MSNTQKGGDLHPVVGELLSHTKNNEDLVLSLAIAIDVALDKEQGCGTGVSLNSLSSPKKFGEWANLCKAAFALAAWKHNRDGGRRGAEVTLNEAVHSGWCYAVILGGRIPNGRGPRAALQAGGETILAPAPRRAGKG
jgi:hypothetical protein